jgi:hypothetical protein
MSNAAPVIPKINYASSMIVEDHLKKLLTMTRGKAWKFTDNKMLPRSQHSPFGDFPVEYMKNVKTGTMEPVPLIANAEQSIAATGKCKFDLKPQCESY